MSGRAWSGARGAEPWPSIRRSPGVRRGTMAGRGPGRLGSRGARTRRSVGGERENRRCPGGSRDSHRDPGPRRAPRCRSRSGVRAARPDGTHGVPARLRRLPGRRGDPRPPRRARARARERREPHRHLDELRRRRQRGAGGERRRRPRPDGTDRARGDRRRVEDRLRPGAEPRAGPGARGRGTAVPRDGAVPGELLALRPPGVSRGPARAVARPSGSRDPRRVPAPQPGVLLLGCRAARRGARSRRSGTSSTGDWWRPSVSSRDEVAAGPASLVWGVVEHGCTARRRPRGDVPHADAGGRARGRRPGPSFRGPPASRESLRGRRGARGDRPADRAAGGAPERAGARAFERASGSW